MLMISGLSHSLPGRRGLTRRLWVQNLRIAMGLAASGAHDTARDRNPRARDPFRADKRDRLLRRHRATEKDLRAKHHRDSLDPLGGILHRVLH